MFPSLYDTFSLVLREAAAVGTPAVVTRGGSPAEAIADGENGFLAEDTPEDLARIIRHALADPAALRTVGEHAKESIPIGWEKVITCVAARYEALIERSRKGELKRRHDALRGILAERMREFQKQYETLRDSSKKC